MASNGDTSTNMANPGNLSDDNGWGSDFNESVEELYSQEIEDNKINENLEAQLRNVLNTNPTNRSANTDELRQVIPVTTESANRSTPTACTGAIPKRGFSYLVNSSAIPQSNLVNHALFQKAAKPEPRHKNIEALNENKRETAVILSTSPARPPNDAKVKVDKKKTRFATKNSPGKLKPDAFNFLNKIPAKIYKNDKDVTEERKHLVPTAFIHAGNLHHSQLMIEHPMNHDTTEINSPEPSAPPDPDSDHDNYEPIGEDNRNGNEQFEKPALPSRPPPILKHLSGTVFKPNAPPTKLKPTATNLVQLDIKLSISPGVKDDTICKENSVPTDMRTGKTRTQIKSARTIPPDLITRPLPPVPISDQPNLILQPKPSPSSSLSPELISRHLPLSPTSEQPNLILQPRSSLTSPLSPELMTRPLPLVPVSDQPNLILEQKPSPSSPLSPELISRPLPLSPTSEQPNLILQPRSSPTSPPSPELISRNPLQVPIPDQSNMPGNGLGTVIAQTGTSDENLCEELNATPVQVATLPALYPIDAIFEIDKPTPASRRATNDQTLDETPIVPPRQSTQQRLAQIISSQSQVSSAVLQSQKRISTAIASRVSNIQKNATSASNTSTEFSAGSLQNLSHDMDDEDYLQSSVRSPSSITNIQKPKVPQRKISNHLTIDNPFNFQNHAGKNSSPVDSTLNTSPSLLNNSPIKENTNPPPYPDIEALHSCISRPSLPQKLKTTQRSLSCSSLVQSFRDMSFAMWNPPPKDKRVSAGSPSFDRVTKEFTKETSENFRPKGFSVSNVEVPKVIAPKPMKSMPDFPTEKNSLSRNAWYHDVDAREAQRRLLNFIDQNGAFLIRPSSRKTNEIQHTACIVFSGRIINMHIRRKSNGQFALGTGKEGEQTFPSICDLIKYHQEVPIVSSGQPSSVKSFSACLRVTPPKP